MESMTAYLIFFPLCSLIPFFLALCLVRLLNRSTLEPLPESSSKLRIALAWVAFFVGMVPAIRFTPLHFAEAIILLSAVGGTGVLLVWALIGKMWNPKYSYLVYACSQPFSLIFILNTAAVGVLLSYNGCEDPSKPYIYEAKVVRTIRTRSLRLAGSKSTPEYKYVYQLPQRPYSPFPNRVKASTDRDTLENLNLELDRVLVEIRQGKLGIPWYAEENIKAPVRH